MNLKTYAEKSGMSLAEAKAETGLTHWNQKVPEIMEADVEVMEEPAEPTEPESVNESLVVESVVDAELTWDDCPVNRRKLFNSIKRRRMRSPYWEFRHLLRK